MKNKLITLLAVLGMVLITTAPSQAWYRYGYGCCYYGYNGAAAGAAIAGLAIGALAGAAIASQPYYGYGYYYAPPPVYYYPYGGYYGPAYGYYYGW